MDFKVAQQASTDQLLQTVNLYTMKKQMNIQEESMGNIVKMMNDTTSKLLEQSVTPHKGASIDIKL